jgi:hypothetical protein
MKILGEFNSLLNISSKLSEAVVEILNLDPYVFIRMSRYSSVL